MGADKKKSEEGFLDFCKKARDSFLFCCKWLSATLVVCWEIIRTYILVIIDHCKIKLEFNKLGQEAYTQWKKHKTFSLQSNFVKIKEFEKSIDGYSARSKRFIEKLNVLFDFSSSEIPEVSIKIETVETVKVEPKAEKQVVEPKVEKQVDEPKAEKQVVEVQEVVEPKTTKKPATPKPTKPVVKKATKKTATKAKKKTPKTTKKS